MPVDGIEIRDIAAVVHSSPHDVSIATMFGQISIQPDSRAGDDSRENAACGNVLGKELLKCGIHAVDGDLGSVHDLYFDDETWTIQHFIVGTGRWLPGRKLLLSPAALPSWNVSDSELKFDLTRSDPPKSGRLYGPAGVTAEGT